jgi:hypothetical protein
VKFKKKPTSSQHKIYWGNVEQKIKSVRSGLFGSKNFLLKIKKNIFGEKKYFWKKKLKFKIYFF